MPSNRQDIGTQNEPTVILICGWLGAKLPTLRKYAEGYRNLYPSSTQVIVSADPWRYWKYESAREQAVLPAVRKLEESGVVSNSKPRILAHVMSNGGAMSLTDVASALHKRNIHPITGTKCAIVFDSAPAPASLILFFRAYTASMRSRLKRLLEAVPLTVIYALNAVLLTIIRTPDPIARALKTLNDPHLFPWTSTATPRLYLYSAADKIVPYEAVEEHAARARMTGFPVQMVRFDNSGHVSHARDDPDRYWDAIRAFWSGVINR